MNGFYVYAYVREDGSPYYIGKGKGRRAYSKQRVGAQVPEDLSRIIFLAKGLYEREALILEKKLIAGFGRKDQGTGILRNLTDGGEGMSNPSKETRRKMSEARKGLAVSKETRRKLSEAHTGKTRSEETRRKISEARTGMTFSDEHRRKLSEAGVRRSHPDETRRKMSESKQSVSREDVEEMRRLYATGLSRREIGERFKVSESTIHRYTSPKGRDYGMFRETQEDILRTSYD